MSREQNMSAQKLLGDLVNSGEFDRFGEVFGPDIIDHHAALQHLGTMVSA
jgi:hypothetical protein